MRPYKELAVPTDGVLSFAIRDGTDRPWWWYLDLRGTPLYLIGNACGTCEAIYQRIQNQEVPLAADELSARLAEGVQDISNDLLQTVVPLLPKGKYIVGVIELRPTRLDPAQRPRFVGCHADYFWWRPFYEHPSENVYELILPFVPEANLSRERIASYRAQLERGQTPTALALSMVDERALAGRFVERALVHFLLDGHHKVMAASEAGRPLTVVSFLRETALTGIPMIDVKVRAYYGGAKFE